MGRSRSATDAGTGGYKVPGFRPGSPSSPIRLSSAQLRLIYRPTGFSLET